MDDEPTPDLRQDVRVVVYMPLELAAWMRAKARERLKSDSAWIRDLVVSVRQRERDNAR